MVPPRGVMSRFDRSPVNHPAPRGAPGVSATGTRDGRRVAKKKP